MTIQPTIKQLRLMANVKGELWAMMPNRIEEFALSILEFKEEAPTTREDNGITFDDYFDKRTPASIAGGVGIVHVKGALVQGGPAIYEKLGFVTRYETISAELAELLDGGIDSILLRIDSPGGTVAGNKELAQEIADFPIPVVAHCSGLACSGAYKIAAGAGEIHATPSAEVGNIGTILSWADCSEFWEKMGVEFKALTSEGADLKSTFHLEPNEEQIEFLQDRINAAGEEFRSHVEAGRAAAGATLSEEVFRAGWYSGTAALSLGLIDEISTFENTLLRMQAEGL